MARRDDEEALIARARADADRLVAESCGRLGRALVQHADPRPLVRRHPILACLGALTLGAIGAVAARRSLRDDAIRTTATPAPTWPRSHGWLAMLIRDLALPFAIERVSAIVRDRTTPLGDDPTDATAAPPETSK